MFSQSGLSRRSSICQPNLEDSDSDSENHPSFPSPSSSDDDESESERSTSSAARSDDGLAGPGAEEDALGGAGEGFDAEEPRGDARRIVSSSVASPSLVPEAGSRATTPRALDSSLPKEEGAGEEAEEQEQVHGEVKGGSGEDEGGKRRTSMPAKGGAAVDAKGREEAAGSGVATKEERLGPRKTRVVIKVRFYFSSFRTISPSPHHDRT